MTRLPTRSKLWLALLVLPWAVALGLSTTLWTTDQVRWITLVVRGAAAPDDYPHFLAMRGGRLAEAGLQPGDALLGIGDQDLRGASSWAFLGLAAEAALESPVVEVRYARAGKVLAGKVDFSASRLRAHWIQMLAIGIFMAATGILIFLRAPQDGRALPILGFAALYATMAQSGYAGLGKTATHLSFLLNHGAEASFGVLAAFVCLKWPGKPLGRVERHIPWLFALFGLVDFAAWHPGPLGYESASRLWSFADAARTGSGVLLIGRGYRLCDARRRRQLRWAAYGAFVAMAVMATTNLMEALQPELGFIRDWSLLVMLVMPIGFLIAIVRDDLFDIDRLIGATVTFTLLSIALLAALLAGVPRLAQAAGPALGIAPETSQIILSVLVAALVVPGQRFVRPRVDGLFFRERVALQRGVERLLRALAVCGDARELTESAGRGLDDLLRPEVCAIYALEEAAFLPIFARGRAVPPAVDAAGPLLARIAASREPLDVEGWRRRHAPQGLTEAEVAALAGVSVIVPVHLEDRLVAFLGLGVKRSGDIYTQTDRALLALVGQTVSARLLQLDQEAVIRETRSMQDSLRRYVPGAIAEQLSAGEELTAGTREVTVLFVDIRGYTELADGQRAEAIFSFVNQYTEAVSRVVRDHNGSVVEFSGDGMMAVFGAPVPDPEKERSAVRAGCAILDEVTKLVAPGGETAEPVAVGVGIASGEAYVGSVRAVDRLIWTALGNTTNLAARLQALTRELDRAMVIDAATWRAGGDVGGRFESRPGVPIRGRSEPADLYVLEIPS